MRRGLAPESVPENHTCGQSAAGSIRPPDAHISNKFRNRPQVSGSRLDGIGIGSAGTRLATEACGQLRLLKFRITF